MILEMSFLEKQARAQEKRDAILDFLGSGECYTSLHISSRVMSCSVRAARDTLDALIRDGALKSETVLVQSRRLKLYGITPHGLALANEFDSQYFEVGRTNPSYVPHHLETQAARLDAEAAGWTNWQPGKNLYKTGLLKVPDALCVTPDDRKVAIEIERHIKTRKRYEEILSLHLQEMSKKSWSEVHYLAKPELIRPLQNIFRRIEAIPVKGERVVLEEKHRDRFRFFSMAEWPPIPKD